jgi:hypothetical protein
VANDRDERLIVRQLRMWRPDVVLTDNLTASKSHPWERLAGPLVLQAVQRAADPAAFPDQIVVAGLQPWTVRKVLGVVYPPESASVTVDTNRLSMQLGCSLADYTVSGRGLLSDSPGRVPGNLGCRLLWSQAAQDVATRTLFSGIPLTPVGETRRATSAPPPARLEALARTAQHLRNLHAIADGAGENGNPPADFPQIEQLLQGQEPAGAGRLLFRLAQQFISAGQYAAADHSLAVLVERFPDHALNDAALWWIIRYHGSVELQHAFGPPQLARLPSLSMTPPGGPKAGAVQPASMSTPVDPTATVGAESLLWALGIGERIRQSSPALYADPRVQFPLAAVQRRLGQSDDAGRLLKILSNSQLANSWRRAARAEHELLERPVRPTSAFDRANTPPPDLEIAGETKYGESVELPRRPAHQGVTASRAERKPLLDGNLNDSCWRSESWVRIPSADSGPLAELNVAYDAEFVFVALRCAHVMVGDATSRQDPRVRDAALFGQDRVALDLDVDRDYQTYYRFTVDQQGRTHDSCGDDPRWNPQWYVAAHAGAAEWVVEAAIPRSELVPGALTGGETWCIRARRILPSMDRLSVTDTTPATDEFALLRFAKQP